MKKILIVGSQHGDELLGIKLFDHLQENYPDLAASVDYYCANPKAFVENKRFIDSDMNRSYNKQDNTYEARQAKILMKKISTQHYNYILDCHTTTTDIGVTLIISNRNKATDRILNASSKIKNIIVMPEKIAKNALISNVNNAVSIECNDELAAKTQTLEMLSEMIRTLVANKINKPSEKTFFYVKNFIKSSELPAKKLQNFQLYKERYPILYGGDTKKRTYKGFWAIKKEQLSV